MKFLVATKHLHLGIQYREPEEEDEPVSLLGDSGSYEIVRTEPPLYEGEEGPQGFGFSPVKRG